jgi:hypothetical protein
MSTLIGKECEKCFFPCLDSQGFALKPTLFLQKERQKLSNEAISNPYPESRDNSLCRGCGGGASTK